MANAISLIIVGGGYAGMELARAMDSTVNVTLVEAREKFVHNVAAIRAVVEPALLEQALLPYDNLLRNGRIVRGRVAAVSESGVNLSDGSHLAADLVVVATGSTYAAPFKASGDSVQSIIDSNRSTNARLNLASKVAVVGGGAVGIELAAEIKSAHADKKVTLISADARLLPGFDAGLGRDLAACLKALDVELLLGSKVVEGLQSISEPFSGELVLENGSKIAADLVFPAVGARVVNDLLQPLPGVNFNEQGRALVDSWFRPSSFKNVFVVGDLAATGEAMTIVSLSRQVPALAKILKSVAKGKPVEEMKPYTPWPVAGILVPVGAKDGASLLPLRKGFKVGGKLTSLMKGKTLFVPRYKKMFGVR